MEETKPLALITGASSGIGEAFARALAARGYDLVLVARREDRLRRLADELSNEFHVHCTALRVDLTDAAELRQVEELVAGSPHLQMLVNNAGFGTLGGFAASPIDGPDAMHRLHVMATLRLTHAAVRNMNAHDQGAVINVSSVAAFAPRPGTTSYYATKAWINCFTEGLALELKADGSRVRLQALCPGFTRTEFHDVLGTGRDFISHKWWMSAEDVVEASLRGLDAGKLFVVPGWRYKLVVLLLRILPRGVLHFVLLKGPASLRRERQRE